MLWKDLKLTDQAPRSGQMLVYLRNEVLFQPYTSLAQVQEIVGPGPILELHLFDDKKEYRSITSESSRHKDGVIEHVADFAYDEDTVYKETPILEKGGTITVLNHLSYDKNGMASIDDYRLTMEEPKNG